MVHRTSGRLACPLPITNPLQRNFRDQRAAAGYFSFSTDAQLPPWGLVAMGGEFKSPTL